MAFTNETSPDADRPRYESFGFMSPFNGDLVPPSKWTIDRERDIFLVSLGGQGGEQSEIPEFFALVWKGSPIGFRAFHKGRGDYQSGAELWWKIFRVGVPKPVEGDRSKILDFIREAVDARGSGYRRDHVTAVNIEIDDAPFL